MTVPDMTPPDPAPAMGPIQASLQGLDREERLRRKAAHHLMNAGPARAITQNGVTIVFEQPALSDDGKIVFVWLDAFDAVGVKLPGPADREWAFVNPPMRVHDGTYTAVVTPDGTTVQYPNYVEDVAAAFEAMVFRSVLGEARRMGWPG